MRGVLAWLSNICMNALVSFFCVLMYNLHCATNNYLDIHLDPHKFHPLVQFHYYRNIHYHKVHCNLWQLQSHYNWSSNHMSDIPYHPNNQLVNSYRDKISQFDILCVTKRQCCGITRQVTDIGSCFLNNVQAKNRCKDFLDLFITTSKFIQFKVIKSVLSRIIMS